jgi:penicillin-binding protein 2
VLVENAGFGSTAASPIAGLMMEKYIKGEVTNKALEKRILELDLENKPAPKPLLASETNN